MSKKLRRCCEMLLVYSAALLICVGGMMLLGMVFAIPNASMIGVGLWFIVCLGSLCVPDEGWDKIFRKR